MEWNAYAITIQHGFYEQAAMRSLLASPTVTIRRGGWPKPYRRIGNYVKIKKISETCASGVALGMRRDALEKESLSSKAT
ncbi:hypothetical protein HK28_11880 [Acetobacter sp. DsW_063]|nr:hypothetical protein HK28_11880 [Acetobacter sp. DsW_063]